MSTTAFNDLERAEVLREQQAEVARDERARNIDRRAVEQLQREALLDALRKNGPTALQVANARIAELEMQRDETAHEIAEWVKDLQAYFPGATTMHDVYRGIEAMESQRNVLISALQVTEGNVASLAGTHPHVYGVWLDVVRNALKVGDL